MISNILIKLGGFLLTPLGALHDALKGEAPVMQSANISNDSQLTTTDGVYPRTVLYYVGGTFAVTFLVVSFLCGMGKLKLFKKKRKVTRRRRPTKRRRTYRRRK